MPASSPDLRVAIARAGYAAAHGDAERVERTRRDLAAERIASYVEKIVADAPALTPDQAARIAVLLRGTAA